MEKKFSQLAKRFDRYAQVIHLDSHSAQIEEFMDVAGELLFKTIRAPHSLLQGVPGWMQVEPSRTRFGENIRTGEVLDHTDVEWATYWWYAVVWLALDKFKGDIAIPRNLTGKVPSPKSWPSFQYEFLPSRFLRRKVLKNGRKQFISSMTDDALVGIWQKIAMASADTCFALAKLSKAEVDTREVTGPTEKPVTNKPRLPKKAQRVLALLRNLSHEEGLTGPEIIKMLDAEHISLDQSTLTKNHIPILKKYYGVKNKRGIGYYIDR